jgi:phage tail sheath gpL-like
MSPINFNEIPTNIRVPGTYVEVDNSRANRGLIQNQKRMLVFGQKLSTGTVASNLAQQVFTVDKAKEYFGKGSQLANMVDVIKKNNGFTELWAIALDDNGAGVAASGTITITGPATQAGTISLYINGQLVQVGVSNSDTANTIAANINTAINVLTDLPVISSVSTNVVTVTCRHKGLWGNGNDIRLNYQGDTSGERTPAGVTVTILQPSGGTANPDTTNALAAVPEEVFDYWITPYTDSTNLTKIEDELNLRWNGLQMKEGHAFSCYTGTSSALSTFGAGRNNPHISIIGANNSPSPPWEWASAFGAQAAAKYSIDPARPLQLVELVGIKAPPKTNQFNYAERNVLLYDGNSTFIVTEDNRVKVERAITTYQVSNAGTQDPSYLDTETLLTLAEFRQTLRNILTAKFIVPRMKLADNMPQNFSSASAKIVTPGVIRDEIIAIYSLWQDKGWVDTSEEAALQFKNELQVERDKTDPNRVNVRLSPDLMNQMRVVAASIQFLL